jgi:hypothetical protein
MTHRWELLRVLGAVADSPAVAPPRPVRQPGRGCGRGSPARDGTGPHPVAAGPFAEHLWAWLPVYLAWAAHEAMRWQHRHASRAAGDAVAGWWAARAGRTPGTPAGR